MPTFRDWITQSFAGPGCVPASDSNSSGVLIQHCMCWSFGEDEYRSGVGPSIFHSDVLHYTETISKCGCRVLLGMCCTICDLTAAKCLQDICYTDNQPSREQQNCKYLRQQRTSHFSVHSEHVAVHCLFCVFIFSPIRQKMIFGGDVDEYGICSEGI